MRICNDRRQVDSHDCGPTAAAVALDLIGFERSESDRLSKLIPCTPTNGTCPGTLDAFFHSIGCHSQSGEMTRADLAHHTRQGRPVLCLIQCDGSGHWVTVYRVTAQKVFYHCPLDGSKVTSAGVFGLTWWDWDRRGTVYSGFGMAVWRP